MAIFKTTSIKTVINKLYRDLALEDSNYEFDFIEWMGEALELIGSFSQLEQKIRTIYVSDHKGSLPRNFISLQQVRYNGHHIAFNPSTFFGHVEDSPNLFCNTKESYTLNPDYIITSFEEGELEMSYLAIPTDSDGYPKMPDNQYFKEALFWYCYRQLLLRGYKSRVPEINYFFADEKWKFYCTAARNQANYPSLEEYERFRQVWVGLLPLDLHSRNYDLSSSKDIELEVKRADNLIGHPGNLKEIKVILDGGDSTTQFD